MESKEKNPSSQVNSWWFLILFSSIILTQVLLVVNFTSLKNDLILLRKELNETHLKYSHLINKRQVEFSSCICPPCQTSSMNKRRRKEFSNFSNFQITSGNGNNGNGFLVERAGTAGAGTGTGGNGNANSNVNGNGRYHSFSSNPIQIQMHQQQQQQMSAFRNQSPYSFNAHMQQQQQQFAAISVRRNGNGGYHNVYTNGNGKEHTPPGYDSSPGGSDVPSHYGRYPSPPSTTTTTTTTTTTPRPPPACRWNGCTNEKAGNQGEDYVDSRESDQTYDRRGLRPSPSGPSGQRPFEFDTSPGGYDDSTGIPPLEYRQSSPEKGEEPDEDPHYESSPDSYPYPSGPAQEKGDPYEYRAPPEASPEKGDPYQQYRQPSPEKADPYARQPSPEKADPYASPDQYNYPSGPAPNYGGEKGEDDPYFESSPDLYTYPPSQEKGPEPDELEYRASPEKAAENPYYNNNQYKGYPGEPGLPGAPGDWNYPSSYPGRGW